MNVGGDKLAGKWRVLLSMVEDKDKKVSRRQKPKYYAENMWRGLNLVRQYVSAALQELEQNGCVKQITSKDSRKKCYEITDFGRIVAENLSQFKELLKRMEEHEKWQEQKEQKNQVSKNQENQT